jgi:hypothetical protein
MRVDCHHEVIHVARYYVPFGKYYRMNRLVFPFMPHDTLRKPNIISGNADFGVKSQDHAQLSGFDANDGPESLSRGIPGCLENWQPWEQCNPQRRREPVRRRADDVHPGMSPDQIGPDAIIACISFVTVIKRQLCRHRRPLAWKDGILAAPLPAVIVTGYVMFLHFDYNIA